MREQSLKRNPHGNPIERDAMNGTVEKANDFKKTVAKLLAYCKTYLPVIMFALIAAAGGTALQVMGPDKLKDLTNEIMKGLPVMQNGNTVLGSINMEIVSKLVWILILFYGVSFLLSYLQSYIMATVTQVISKRMRTDISQKINRLPLKYFDTASVGDVLSRVTNDVDAIGQTLTQSIGTVISSGIMLIGTFVMMLYNSWILTLTAVGTCVIGIILSLFITKVSQKYFKQQQEELGRINGHIEEVYTGHNVVKVYNGGKEAKRIFEESNNNLYSSAWKSQFLSGLMMLIMNFIGNLGYVAVCVVGAALSINGTISFGVIVAFMMYIRQFTQPLSQMAQVMNNLQRAVASGERVFDFLDEPELEKEIDKPNSLINIKGDVEFEHVKFGYTPNKPVIRDFSIQIKAGQKVAIVGPTGAGKTTMVNLLMRFYELDKGEICIDGIPIHKVPRENVHAQFGMVLQDTWIFEGTIRDNIIYNKQGVTEEEVMKASETVGLHHFIKTLPDGYDTLLNDKASLSEGQKQLITIARAIIQDAPLLILDEATSSVDTRTEHLVQDAMEKLTMGRTSFVIAHRLSTIKNADIILVMKDGDIIESGNHEELLAKKGFYSELYNSQFAAA
jgi:ATP-binding cassette subfamily B multidrug efflux pump